MNDPAAPDLVESGGVEPETIETHHVGAEDERPAVEQPSPGGVRTSSRGGSGPATASRTRRAHWIFPQALDAVRSLLMIVVAALFTLTFIMQPFSIPSESMERTLLVGDFLLVNKSLLAPAGGWGWLLPYRAPKRGDIIVFHFPLDPPDHLVKRVIGAPGDRLRVRNGRAQVNGIALPEPYAVFERSYGDAYRDQFPSVPPSDPAVDTRWALEIRQEVRDGQLQVPEDSYFVMGDNRNHSRDSRYWGYVPEENIVGTPFLIYFSVRKPSATGEGGLPDDRLGKSAVDGLMDFARWNRMLQVVR